MNAEENYKIAADAIRRKKFDQAIRYFDLILEHEPEYIDARKGLRLVYKNHLKTSKATAMITGLATLIQIVMCKSTKKWEKGIIACEKYLRKNPDSAWALQQEANFAVEKEFNKTACFCYETLAELKPDDEDIVIDAADFLSDQGDAALHEKANAMMAHLVKLNPDSMELSSEHSRISAKKTLGAYEGAESSMDVLQDTEATRELEKESQDIKTDADLEQAISRAKERDEEEPNNARHKETIADLLMRKNEHRDAIDMYKQAIELDPNNENTRTKQGDAKILLLTTQLAKIKKRMAKVDAAEKEQLTVKFKQGTKKLLDLKMKEFTRRLKVNPNNMKTHFDLGELFYKAGKLDDAIKKFQKSVADARMAYASQRYLGLCFKSKKLYDLAIDQFTDAAGRPNVKADQKLELQYETAGCLMELGQKDKALAAYKQILEKDFGYKDVTQKVDELQKG